MDIDLDKLASGPIAAGIAGSLIGLRFVSGASWAERAANVLAGSLTSIYVTPGLASWLGVSKLQEIALMAFALGLFGLSLAAALAQAVRDVKLAEIISGWISRKG